MADSLSSDVELLSQDVVDKILEKPVKEELDPKDEIIEIPETDEEEAEVLSDDEPEVEPEPADKVEKKEFLPHERPAKKDILKEFPELFKKFPSLEHAFFREKEFTEIFPTVAEAKEAAESTQALDDFRADLFTGTGEKFVAALKDANELNKFSQNFLTNLQKTDKETYWTAITPTLQQLVRAFHSEGKNRNDENVLRSAENLSIYLFGTSEVAEGKKSVVKELEKEDPRVTSRLADIERREYNSFNISVQEGIFNGLSEVIDLKDQPLSTKMKQLISDQIVKDIDKAIQQDATHMKYVNGLWNKAKGSYTSEIKSKIVTAYLERAKSLVPSIRRRLLSEALIDSPAKSQEKLDKVRTVQARREPGSQGKPSGTSVKVHNAKAVDWNKTSDADFLNGNINLKNRSK